MNERAGERQLQAPALEAHQVRVCERLSERERCLRSVHLGEGSIDCKVPALSDHV